MTLKQRYQIWRLRPGLAFARKLAEQQAWKHPNAHMLGPEMNLMSFARGIGYRLTDADQHGKIDGLCLDAAPPIAKLRRASAHFSTDGAIPADQDIETEHFHYDAATRTLTEK